MCEIRVTTTRYARCPATCTSVSRDLITDGCPHYASTQRQCENPREKHLGQTVSRNQCHLHRDEGYAERDTR
ncbi:hypothetical protein P175DRAFT_0439802 [Aspergillus ochraceoroseus IBT 24754]|uniref:Uncharacterized protein n=1 Tax=Aspergillus ochraceoroseus IBT 24754 TaxID=1392256 RepID=A0A2T5LU65_9EURO|nr:uncharacterized protein P175DRAFT_0439802 [Aspergillus ochraceoroseus IBT 24754]PTU19818.1 hypothetical protein P175DRAFT_0439802 [Aspergillus ochraceoroseus IBT 24754]